MSCDKQAHWICKTEYEQLDMQKQRGPEVLMETLGPSKT